MNRVLILAGSGNCGSAAGAIPQGSEMASGSAKRPARNGAERLDTYAEKRFSGPTTAHTVLPAELV